MASIRVSRVTKIDEDGEFEANVSSVVESFALSGDRSGLSGLYQQTRSPADDSRFTERNFTETRTIIRTDSGTSGGSAAPRTGNASAGKVGGGRAKDQAPSGNASGGVGNSPNYTVIIETVEENFEAVEFAFTDFGFDIPDNAVPTGLEIRVLRSAIGDPLIEDGGEIINCSEA